jgi:hypothetical protein
MSTLWCSRLALSASCPLPNRQHCGIAAGVTRLGGPPRKALYTVTLLRVAWQQLYGGGRVFIRPQMVRLGMAVRSACFAAAVTWKQPVRYRSVSVVRLLSVCRPSSITGQSWRSRKTSSVGLLTALCSGALPSPLLSSPRLLPCLVFHLSLN